MRCSNPVARFLLLAVIATAVSAARAAEGPLVKVADYKMHHARVGAAAAVLGDHLYIFGGSGGSSPIHQAERIDLRTGQSELLSARFVARRHHVVAEHEGKFWIVGGQSYSKPGSMHEAAVEIYDPATNTVSRVPDNPDPRGKAGSVKLGHELHIIGGSRHAKSGAYSQTNTTRILNLNTGAWREGLPMPTPREAPAVQVGAFILVAGGYSRGNRHDAVEMFVPAEQVWKKLPNLARPISAHGAAVLGRWLFLFGDFNDSRVVLSYDLPTRKTTRIDPDFVATQFTTAVTAGDRIYLVGGQAQDFGRAGGTSARNAAQSGGSERDIVQVFALRPDGAAQ